MTTQYILVGIFFALLIGCMIFKRVRRHRKGHGKPSCGCGGCNGCSDFKLCDSPKRAR